MLTRIFGDDPCPSNVGVPTEGHPYKQADVDFPS